DPQSAGGLMPEDSKKKDPKDEGATKSPAKAPDMEALDLMIKNLTSPILLPKNIQWTEVFGAKVKGGNDYFDSDLLLTRRNFDDELATLRKRVEDQAQSLTKEKTGGDEKQKKIEALETSVQELRAKERLGFLLTRVNPAAQRKLLSSEDLQNSFFDTK